MELFSLLLSPISKSLFTAAVLGSLLGLERELARKDPSLRTFMLVCLGSCAYSIMSLHTAKDFGVPNAEPSRIAAQIVVGIGFLGAGTIFRSRDRVMGLTTAALMWVAAAIGMAVGFDRYDVAVLANIISLSFMVFLSLVHRVLGPLLEKPSHTHQVATEDEPLK